MKAIFETGNPYRQLSDEKLIPLVISGQQQACTVLVNRHERLLHFILKRYLTDPNAIEEVTQDTFMRAFRALPAFRGDSKFSTWLGKIAVSAALSRLRLKRYTPWLPIEDFHPQWQDGPCEGGALLEKEEAGMLLRQALHRLGPQDATALELFYLREQNIEEISDLTGWTTSNIKSRLARARKRLHEVLVKEELYAESHS